MINLFSTFQCLLTKLLRYTGIYTIAIVILHFADVGQFTDWCITAWPWNWSCLCILYIHIVLFALLFLAEFIYGFAIGINRGRILDQYEPTQREFIRKIMKW